MTKLVFGHDELVKADGKLVYHEIDTNCSNAELGKAHEEMLATRKAASASLKAFNKLLEPFIASKVSLPAGYSFRIGHNFGKLAWAAGPRVEKKAAASNAMKL